MYLALLIWKPQTKFFQRIANTCMVLTRHTKEKKIIIIKAQINKKNQNKSGFSLSLKFDHNALVDYQTKLSKSMFCTSRECLSLTKQMDNSPVKSDIKAFFSIM